MDGVDKNLETIDDLLVDGMKILQSRRGFRFSIDAVLLARFAGLRRGDRVIDLGTGSGVIPLLLTTRERDLKIIGLEIQPAMVDLAGRSVRMNHRDQQIEIVLGDLREADVHYGPASFNLVVSNPPYQKAGTGKINPDSMTALARHELACSLEDVVRVGARLLKPRGRLALVHRPQRLGEIFAHFHAFGLTPRRLRLVHPQVDRKPNLVLFEGEKGAKTELEVLPPLVVYTPAGGYTEEIYGIYFGGTRGDKTDEPE